MSRVCLIGVVSLVADDIVNMHVIMLLLERRVMGFLEVTFEIELIEKKKELKLIER